MRLTPSVGNQDGLVEICLERADDTFWTGVCKEDMTLAAATVICRQLGFLHANSSGTISCVSCSCVAIATAILKACDQPYRGMGSI